MQNSIQTFFNVAILQKVATGALRVTFRKSFHLVKEVKGIVSAVTIIL